jgi:peptide/nickel transport system permease protein
VSVGVYLLRRVLQTPLVLLFVTLIVFALMHVSPGDPVDTMLGVFASPESVARLRKDFHLDRSLPEQYTLWLGRAVQGDLGYSIRTRESVRQIIRDRLPVSVALAAAATLLSLLVAVPAGVIAAYKRNTVWDYSLMAFTMLGLSVPNFAMALIFILVFAVYLGWVPISGIGFFNFSETPWMALAVYILPTVSLAFPHIAELARLMRASMLEVLDQDFIRVALAKGVSPYAMLSRHALRNALLPVVTITAITFAQLVGTTITIEFIFAIPGIGTALIQSVVNRDFPVIQGITLVVALFFIGMNILADALYTLIDPRVVYS